MNFSLALALLKEGRAVARSGWNGKGMWIKVQFPDANSKMTLPYIYMKTVDNNRVPWLASQTDILANDWVEDAGEGGGDVPTKPVVDPLPPRRMPVS
jgi:hypothetical protein